MEDVIVGVDLGSSKVVTIIGRVEDESINVLGVSSRPSRGIRKGQIVDIEEAASAINESLDQAERMAGYSVGRVFVSISGIHIESQNSRGVVAISDPRGEINETDVDRVLEAAGAVSLPSTRSIVHVLPKNFTVDGEGGVKDPIGMSGVRLEVDTHIISANSTAVKNIQKVFEEQAGVTIGAPVFSGLASSLATLTDTEKELGVVLVDIGAGITNVSSYIEGSLSFSSVIPIGARHITNDLAIGLRVSLDSAEKIKLYLSSSQKSKPEGKDGETDEINLSELALSEEIKKVSRKTLVEGIIRPRINEIFTMVGLELKRSGVAGATPAGIVVTGGGAKTIGVEEACKRMLSMPVRIGIPQGLTGLIDEVQDSMFSTAVGLLFFGKNFKGSAGESIFFGIFQSLNIKPISIIMGNLKKIIKHFIP